MATGSPFSAPQPQVAQPPANHNAIIIVVIVCAVLLVIGLFCAGILAALLLPAVSAARDAARNTQVMNQMKSIGVAVHNYDGAYNQLPPPFATDSSGTPIHSWRVTLLPFIEEQARWEQWNQNEPWDSATNTQLQHPMPSEYQSLFDSDPSSVETHVFTVRDPNSMMPGDKNMKFNDATDGMHNTILAVYLPQRTVNWASPSDVTLQELQSAIANATPRQSVVLLMADGSVRRVASPIDPLQVEAMVTRSGNEIVTF